MDNLISDLYDQYFQRYALEIFGNQLHWLWFKAQDDGTILTPHVNIRLGVAYDRQYYDISKKESDRERVRFMLGSYYTELGHILTAQTCSPAVLNIEYCPISDGQLSPPCGNDRQACGEAHQLCKQGGEPFRQAYR